MNARVAAPAVTQVQNTMADFFIAHAAGVVTHPYHRRRTPGIRCRAFSIFVAQEAQSIPSTRKRVFADEAVLFMVASSGKAGETSSCFSLLAQPSVEGFNCSRELL
jgi:hypothetical protein